MALEAELIAREPGRQSAISSRRQARHGKGAVLSCVRQVLQKRSRRVEGFFNSGVILTTATGAGETALLRRSALAGPVVNNASALFKSLAITPHFFLMRWVTGA
jgi:hypothetical protein